MNAIALPGPCCSAMTCAIDNCWKRLRGWLLQTASGRSQFSLKPAAVVWELLSKKARAAVGALPANPRISRHSVDPNF